MHDIKTDTEFGATVSISDDEVAEKAEGYTEYKLSVQASELGLLIAEKKGWKSSWVPSMGFTEYNLRLRVFTPNELKDYMDAKFKAKLQHMASSEGFLTDDQRQALLILSERF